MRAGFMFGVCYYFLRTSRPRESTSHSVGRLVGRSVGQLVGQAVSWLVGRLVGRSLLPPAHPYATDAVVYTVLFLTDCRTVNGEQVLPITDKIAKSTSH